MGDGFYRSKDPTNSIKVLKEQIAAMLTTNIMGHIPPMRYNVDVAVGRSGDPNYH